MWTRTARRHAEATRDHWKRLETRMGLNGVTQRTSGSVEAGRLQTTEVKQEELESTVRRD